MGLTSAIHNRHGRTGSSIGTQSAHSVDYGYEIEDDPIDRLSQLDQDSDEDEHFQKLQRSIEKRNTAKSFAGITKGNNHAN